MFPFNCNGIKPSGLTETTTRQLASFPFSLMDEWQVNRLVDNTSRQQMRIGIVVKTPHHKHEAVVLEWVVL